MKQPDTYDAIELLTASPDNDSTDQLHVYLVRLQFILCQLENSLISKHTRKYDIETLIVALKCQLISPIGYKFLQSLDCLSLPHIPHLIACTPILVWKMSLSTISNNLLNNSTIANVMYNSNGRNPC